MRTPRPLHVALLVALSSLALAGCGGDDKSSAGDAGVTCEEELPSFALGDADGHAAPLLAAPGEARAGRLLASDLPPELDRLGLAVWSPGDFVLANERVALIIEDLGASDLFDPHGGRPVGMARVEDGKLVEAGDFNEIIFGIAAYLMETTSVSVLNDGADGSAAVVRAAGTLGPIEFLGGILKSLLPGAYDGLPVAMDYVMEPGADAVDVYLEVGNPGATARSVANLLIAFFQPNRMARWSESAGFADPEYRVPLTAFVDDEGVSFAWVAPGERELSQLVEVAGALAFSLGGEQLAPCEATRVKLGTLVMGGPGLPGLQAALARHRGESLRTVVGTVIDAEANGGGPATDARVHVLRADGSHYARVRPDETGTFTVDVPNETVSFVGYRAGTRLSDAVQAAAGVDLVEIVMPAYGTISIEVTDTIGSPIPARVQVMPEAPLSPPLVPADFGETDVASGRAHIAFAMAEPVTLRVDPGTHRVAVSRGFAYELVDEILDTPVTAGQTVARSYALAREVDLPGVMCADYHIHTHRSPDSPDSPQFKLAGMIADGLEIPIRTDHEWIRDFDPVIQSMGLDEFAFGIGGEELTTFTWGHFNLFPLEEDPTRRNGGALEWVGRLPPEVFAEARARPEAPSLIINHPRMGGALGGYFSAAGFDSTTGLVSNPDHWDEEFTLVEVFNDTDFDSVRDSVVADWFALLNSGRRVFAVGSSDSHSIRTAPVGYPRTCLSLGVDDALALRAEGDPVHLVQTTTAAGHSTISGGAYLTVEGPGGAQPGDDVAVGGVAPSFRVRVLAAAWVRGLSYLEVIVDGRTVDSFPIEADPPVLPDPSDPAVRIDETIEIPLEQLAPTGSWVVFHAGSEESSNLLDPVHPGGRRPFAVSNPIFLNP